MIFSFKSRSIRASLSIDTLNCAYLGESFPLTLKVSNHDTVAVTVALDALLHPFTTSTGGMSADVIQIDEPDGPDTVESKSISSKELASTLMAGQTLEKTINFTGRGHPGARLIDFSIMCQPCNILSSQQDAGMVAPSELTQNVTINVVHPFFCDFKYAFYRTPSTPLKDRQGKQRSISDVQEAKAWVSAYRILLDVNLGALGPTDVEVVDMKLEFRVRSDQALSFISAVCGLTLPV